MPKYLVKQLLLLAVIAVIVFLFKYQIALYAVNR